MAISQISALTAHISFLLWELIIWQTRSWQIYLPSNGDFTDSCSDSSLLWELIIWQTRSWQIYPPSNGNFTDSCSDSSHFMTAHISFLLWELDIWQTRCWQIYPPFLSGNFTDSYCDNSYFIPTLRAYHLAHQVLADLPPHQTAISQIPALLWELIFSRPPVKWQFHRFLWNSYFIPSLTAQHLADQVLADLPPLLKGNFTDSCSNLRAHIWQTMYWQIYPLSNGNFTDFCSDSSYFIPTLRAHHLADQVLTDLPPIQWWFYRFLLWQLTTLRTYHLADQVLADLPPIKWQFHRFLLWQLPTLRAQHLTDQVLADLNPHIRWHFHRFLWNSYIIPTLRAQHLADQVLADLLPPIKWQFHRFLLYSESSYLSVQMFSDQPPTH